MALKSGDLVISHCKKFIGRLSYVGKRQSSIERPNFRFIEIKLIHKPIDWHPEYLSCQDYQIVKIGKKHEHHILKKYSKNEAVKF